MSLDEYGWGVVHVSRSNREVAARWMYEGTLPIVVRVGSLVVRFDGERIDAFVIDAPRTAQQ